MSNSTRNIQATDSKGNKVDDPVHINGKDPTKAGVQNPLQNNLDANSKDLTSLATAGFADVGADPTSAGHVQRNGSDVKVYSGGAARNLSNIGSGGQTVADTVLQNPTKSELQTAFDNLSDYDRLVVLGAPEVNSALTIDGVYGAKIEIYGKITSTGSGHPIIDIGGTSAAWDCYLYIAEINGAGEGANQQAIRVQNGPGWTFECNAIRNVKTALQAWTSSSGYEPFDWTVHVTRIARCQVAFDFVAANNIIQGWAVHGVNCFDISDRTVNHRSTNRSTLHWFTSCTLHGNTDANNTYEIDYTAADPGTEGNQYDCKFIGGATSPKAESVVNQLN